MTGCGSKLTWLPNKGMSKINCIIEKETNTVYYINKLHLKHIYDVLDFSNSTRIVQRDILDSQQFQMAGDLIDFTTNCWADS